MVQIPEGRGDIYRLAEDLKVNSDHLLLLMEAAELLGFAVISQGDIILTPLGETFVEAGILAQKEIFAARIRRLPIFKRLVAMLRAAENKKLDWEVVQTALELEFPPEEAGRQLDTVVSWGRYAELVSYEDDPETIYLEPGGSKIPQV